MIQCNIYFGTVGTGAKYQYTNFYKSEEAAKEDAKNAAVSWYYRNEGKHNIPSFVDINDESELTGVSIETLYEEHIHDLMRWYAIPTSLDTIPKRKLR